MSISKYVTMLESLPGTWYRFLPQLKKVDLSCSSQPASRFLTRQSLKEIHAICLAEQVAKAMCYTFPGISTDPQRLPFIQDGPTFSGSLRNAVAASRRRRAAVSGGTRVACDIMSGSEIRNFIDRIQQLALSQGGEGEKIAVARRYYGVNGGVIAQLKAEEDSACERQMFESLESRIQLRFQLGEDKLYEKEPWKSSNATERFNRLDSWFGLVAGEHMNQRVQNSRDFRCFNMARGQIRPHSDDRRYFDRLLSLLTGNPFPGSTLAGYEITLWVDTSLARSYEANSKQGRKTLQEAIEGA